MDDLAEAAEIADLLLKQHDAFSGRASDTITALLARIATMTAALDALEAENARLRKALQFYATGVYSGYHDGTGYVFNLTETDDTCDQGEIARAALTDQ